ncbi:transglycosylase SLT domain-containing protein [Methylobacterium sp. J-090]|uniref:transglycosylase SLT domain-containing protein n=1 Tax=Methylobacterium sp. J-090 TaxID=2836666 RepID=UPI001FB9EB09|nr:transglycosylase SLT domain-containing protein [Methylobacterium sp. J-090]MCJ2082552.1 transglycosylase SLT domain-containing protein [Methylobacterium sp. J-090]
MFLFTTPPATSRDTGASRDAGARAATGAGSTVVEAIRDGAQTSGAGFDYLLATAQRESALNPTAKAGTSSATGLFQFIEQTWLGTMKNAGPKLGLQTYADAITARPDGTYTVADPDARQTILDLRRDPKTAATLAGALTQNNRDALTAALGREPTGGDLYAAHVLGARGAAALINTAQASPARTAALDMPEAAAANRGLFYDKTGRARGAAELYALLSTARSTGAQSGTLQAASPIVLPEGTTAYASLDGGLRSLFQTDKRQGAVSEGVAKLWQGRAATDAARSAPTYFPRSDGTADTTLAEPIGGASAASTPAVQASDTARPDANALVGAPLPPRRPAEFNTASAARTGAPLDPSLFTARSGP